MWSIIGAIVLQSCVASVYSAYFIFLKCGV